MDVNGADDLLPVRAWKPDASAGIEGVVVVVDEAEGYEVEVLFTAWDYMLGF